MEVDKENASNKSEESVVEDESWNLSDFDQNEMYLPEHAEILEEIENINKLNTDMIKKKIIDYWKSLEEREPGMEKHDLEVAFQNYQKIINSQNTLGIQNAMEIPEDPWIGKNVKNENDFYPQKQAQQEEMVRLQKLEENSILIHVDVRRAFDNINPKTLNDIIDKMAGKFEFQILAPFKNIIKHWMNTSASERIKIEGYKEFRRFYGGPQGSLWTPAIWNLYLTTILRNSPLKRMIRLYADNVFIWIDSKNVRESYVSKTIEILKRILRLANMEINEDEIFVYWRGNHPEYVDILNRLIPIQQEQRILGYWFKLVGGSWKFVMKFWLPLYPKKSLIYCTFRERIHAFRNKALGAINYQLQGWFLFGNPKEDYEWIKLNRHIRNSFINWTGLAKISYLDLLNLGILPRENLLIKLTEAYYLAYLGSRDMNKLKNRIDSIIKEIARDLTVKSNLPDQEKGKMEQLKKAGDNFTYAIARNAQEILSWIKELDKQIEKMNLYNNQQEYKDVYRINYGNKALEDWELIRNHHYKYNIMNRYKNTYLLDPDEGVKIRWRNRSYWHLCLKKKANTEHGQAFLDFLTLALTTDRPWIDILLTAMGFEIDNKHKFEEKIRDFIKRAEWEVLDDIIQIVDSNPGLDLKWRRQQLLFICYKYKQTLDLKYIDFLHEKCQSANINK